MSDTTNLWHQFDQWTTPEEVDETITDGDTVIKAHFIGAGGGLKIGTSNRDEAEGQQVGVLTKAGDLLTHPYDPEKLGRIFENSNSLRPNIDAYATNIDGFGYTLVPVLDLDSADADKKLADALWLKKLAEANGAETPALDEEEIEEEAAKIPASDGAQTPKKRELKAFRKQVERDMRIEKANLETFFKFCCYETSFIGLRKRTRNDLEITGNGYWEVVRNLDGKVIEFVYMPAWTMHLSRVDGDWTQVSEKVKDSPISYAKVETRRRFRRFAQVIDGSTTYFKEFGDPRTISTLTGKAYASPEVMAEREPEARPATEIVHFKVPTPLSPYGVPRWIGVLLPVLGSRQAEEINYLYFDNKSVPPMALLVSGGKMSQSSIPRIQNFIKEQIKGKKNFHSILILEAESNDSTAATGKVRIELKPLTGAQMKDELFGQYDERNADKVGSSFRLPRILRGDVRDFNKATAEAALMFAEMQVFQPERDEFDHWINRKLLSELGVRYWTFRSNAPVSRDPVVVAEAIRKLTNAGILTPNEVRPIASELFQREFTKIDDDWGNMPLQVVLAEMAANQVAQEQADDPDAGNLTPAKQQAAGDAKSNKGKKSKKKLREPADKAASADVDGETLTFTLTRQQLEELGITVNA